MKRANLKSTDIFITTSGTPIQQRKNCQEYISFFSRGINKKFHTCVNCDFQPNLNKKDMLEVVTMSFCL
jgi:hypothetical protein